MAKKLAEKAVDWEKTENILGIDQFLWRKRIIALSKLIDEETQKVLDVGAGAMYLRNILPISMEYYPMDCVKRCDKTLVYDINNYEFPDMHVDVCVCAGIIEYVNDIDWLFDCLAKTCHQIVLSYKSKEAGFSTSLYTSKEVTNKLLERGFILTKWDKEFIEWPLLASFKKVTPSLLKNNYFCTGCGACYNKCPSGAIELLPDEQGFLKPDIDFNLCIHCNKCIRVCPATQQSVESNSNGVDCYTAWASDEVRKDSSSGGAFSVMAQEILENGGIVYGAGWNNEFYLNHMGISQITDLKILRHSKYIQSNTKKTFEETKMVLEKGIYVMYVGTPCQIAGLRAYLEKDYENLITVDLICFCVTPVTAFRKYLEEFFGIVNIEDVVFRDKYRGWNADGYTIHKKDGTILKLGLESDYYQKAFHMVLCRNKTCEDCRYADFPRTGDITLGDFWGIDQHIESWNDRNGTSMILANSNRGKKFLSKVYKKFKRIERVPLEWIRGKGNRIEGDGRGRNTNADRFMNELKTKTFKEAFDMVINNKHDVALICLINNNYGNNLTNYALYQFLNEENYSVILIDQTQNAQWKPYKKKWELFAHVPFDTYDSIPSFDNKTDLKKLNQSCNTFLVGSDQLFRAIFVEGMDYHSCMDWVQSDKYKIAYATSFGTDDFEGGSEIKSKMKYYLKRFNAISVREYSGVNILKNEFGIDKGSWVLDPVFLCNKKYYEEMAHMGRIRIPKNNFIGAYILDPSEEKEKIINLLCDKYDIKKYNVICDGEMNETDLQKKWNLSILSKPVVEEWLANVLYSKIYITDSFHGLCFALIFNKDFFVVSKRGSWRGQTRLKSLLGYLKLEDRIIESVKELENGKIYEHIDYKDVNFLLNDKILESKKWILEELCKGHFYNGRLETYDILGERIDKILVNAEERNKLLQRQLNEINYSTNLTVKKLEEIVQNIDKVYNQYEGETKKIRDELISAQKVNGELEKQLTDLYTSNSWKATAGPRKIKSLLLKILKH